MEEYLNYKNKDNNNNKNAKKNKSTTQTKATVVDVDKSEPINVTTAAAGIKEKKIQFLESTILNIPEVQDIFDYLASFEQGRNLLIGLFETSVGKQ